MCMLVDLGSRSLSPVSRDGQESGEQLLLGLVVLNFFSNSGDRTRV